MHGLGEEGSVSRPSAKRFMRRPAAADRAGLVKISFMLIVRRMQLLNASRTAQALPFDKLVPAVAAAATQLAAGAIHAPQRSVMPVGAGGVLLCMPAVGDDIGVTKLITVHGDNARHRLPAIQGEVVVFDSDTGRRRLLLDGPMVTARRTAAVTLLGVQRLMASAPRRVILIGTGVQASVHAEALADFFGVRRFGIAARNARHAADFCAALRARYADAAADAIAMEDLSARCADADLVIALTTATSPVIPAGLPPLTLAVGVGAFKPEMAELPAELLNARHIVVDHLAGAQHEAGDLLRADIRWSTVQDLGSLVEQGAPASPQGYVLKTVGHAAWDLAAARVVLAAA